MFRKRVLVEWWGKLEPGELYVNSFNANLFQEKDMADTPTYSCSGPSNFLLQLCSFVNNHGLRSDNVGDGPRFKSDLINLKLPHQLNN